MQDAFPSQGVRTLFVSDLHLGSPHARIEPFLRLLETCRAERLYFVGDIVDGLRLKKRWLWTSQCDEVISRTLELVRRGTRIFYAPGNHDDFLRPYARDLGFVRIAEDFLHVAADGRRYFVAHGDRYDGRDGDSAIRRYAGGLLYDSLLALNPAVDRVAAWMGRDGATTQPFSASFKTRFRRANAYLERFERSLVAQARLRNCDGVVCGHVHVPKIRRREGLLYCNAGDWIEHATALVENLAGEMSLVTVDSSNRPGSVVRPFVERGSTIRDRPCETRVAATDANADEDFEFAGEPAEAI